MGMSHYNTYRTKCLEENIDMDEQCIPPDEVDRLAEGGDRYCLSFMLNGL
jgi:hypothetical protein